LTDIALKVEIPEIAKLVGEVIDSLTARDVEVRDREGRWWSVRIRPYKTTDNRIEGAVVALVDIDSMKNQVDSHAQAQAFTEGIVDTVRQPLIVLDSKLSVRHANEGFLRVFQVSAKEAIGKRIYDLGNGRWNIPRLRELLEEILPSNTSLRNFAVVHDFPRLGRRKVLINARRLDYGSRHAQLILVSLDDVTPEKKVKRQDLGHARE
jgi:two-component system CheB/CheR fusion protein